MKKFLFPLLLALIFVCFYGCKEHAGPEPIITLEPAATPTVRIIDASSQTLPAITDVSATTVKSCITTDTNTVSNTSVIAFTGSELWVSEKAPCALMKVYDTSGNELLSRERPLAYGIAYEQARDLIWHYYQSELDRNSLRARKRTGYDAGALEGFDIDKELTEYYYGLDLYDDKFWMQGCVPTWSGR